MVTKEQNTPQQREYQTATQQTFQASNFRYLDPSTNTNMKSREKYPGDVMLGNMFSGKILKAQFIKEKIDKLGLVKIKFFRLAK